MAIDLTTIFGAQINVHVQPRQAHRQYVGFPGCHGVLGMHLGTRGRQLIVSGTLAATGASYNAARVNLQTWLNDIEAYLNADAASYTYCAQTYNYLVFDRLQLLPDGEGKTFHYTATGYVTCRFVCFGTMML